jgi:hypothetical protein
MDRFANLSAEEKAKVDAKLAELCDRTGTHWAYSVMRTPGESNTPPLLEIIVDGRICRPITLPRTTESPAEAVCRALEKQAQQLLTRARATSA